MGAAACVTGDWTCLPWPCLREGPAVLFRLGTDSQNRQLLIIDIGKFTMQR